MTADATRSDAAFWKAGARIMRTARAEIRRTRGVGGLERRHRFHLAHQTLGPRGEFRIGHTQPVQPLRHHDGDLHRSQLSVGGDPEDPVLVDLADDARLIRAAIEDGLRLVLYKSPLLRLDVQYLLSNRHLD